jgi:hypothetical protein
VTDDVKDTPRPWWRCALCGGSCPRWGMETCPQRQRQMPRDDEDRSPWGAEREAEAALRTLIERILLARTPSIATEDAVTVALLHNAVIAYVDAVHRGDPHETYRLFVELSRVARLEPSRKGPQ